ncbi:ABC transporter ATP-binding protein [Bombilactobacillus apium]|nr:ATP-binding cassette domain-containing protein [Bombilactobacillus apium]
MGPSGSGKSTLLRLIASLITPTTGTIKYQGRPQSQWAKPQYRQAVSYSVQQPTLFGETVQDNLAFPFIIRNLDFDRSRAESALDQVDLVPQRLKATINSLSGEEKQRVALVRNLLFLPQVLLLDEVTTRLDSATKSCIHKLLAHYHEQGLNIFWVTHDESEIQAADQFLLIKVGHLEA